MFPGKNGQKFLKTPLSPGSVTLFIKDPITIGEHVAFSPFFKIFCVFTKWVEIFLSIFWY